MVNIKANTLNAVNQLIKYLIYIKSNLQLAITECINEKLALGVGNINIK